MCSSLIYYNHLLWLPLLLVIVCFYCVTSQNYRRSGQVSQQKLLLFLEHFITDQPLSFKNWRKSRFDSFMTLFFFLFMCLSCSFIPWNWWHAQLCSCIVTCILVDFTWMCCVPWVCDSCYALVQYLWNECSHSCCLYIIIVNAAVSFVYFCRQRNTPAKTCTYFYTSAHI